MKTFTRRSFLRTTTAGMAACVTCSPLLAEGEKLGPDTSYKRADYVLFTAAHALQMLPAPHPLLDDILPGRTSERDLLRELADVLASHHGFVAQTPPTYSAKGNPRAASLRQGRTPFSEVDGSHIWVILFESRR